MDDDAGQGQRESCLADVRRQGERAQRLLQVQADKYSELSEAHAGDIVAVVTRYFGGTLLGTGGLVKAYSGGVKLALATLPVRERVPRSELSILIDYAAVTPFQRLLTGFEAELLEQEFGVDAAFRLLLPDEQVAPFTAAVTELTNGAALVEVGPAA